MEFAIFSTWRRPKQKQYLPVASKKLHGSSTVPALRDPVTTIICYFYRYFLMERLVAKLHPGPNDGAINYP